MRVLLIDDDSGVVETLALYFSRSHTVQFRSWIEGQAELISLLEEFRPQGVILDFGMSPSGTDIYTWIKHWMERAGSPPVSIVFYTSYANSPEYRKDMMDVGALEDHIIEKREIGPDVPILLRALEA